jgi:hypothetical protein
MEKLFNILYIITNMVCVRPSDDVLGAFSVAEPATEIFAGRTGPDSRIRKTGF